MACTKQSGRGASRWVEIFDYFYKIVCMVFLLFLFYIYIYFFANAAVAVALYAFRELRPAAYRDRRSSCLHCLHFLLR